MPFASRIATRGGDAVYASLPSEVHANYIDAGYGGSQAFDNDDGSAFFDIHDNFFFHSDGFKMARNARGRPSLLARRADSLAATPPSPRLRIRYLQDYGGHDSASHDNVIVVRVYDGQSCINVGDYVPSHEQSFYNNTCVLPPTGSNGKDADRVAPSLGSQPCDGLPHGSGVLIAYANRYYTEHNNASAVCGNGASVRVVDLPPPMEAGSSSHPLPDGLTIMAWAREKLGI